MKTETIKKFNGVIIGTVQTDSRGNATARKFGGPIVGVYESSGDATRRFGGPIVGKGKGFLYGLLGN